MMKWVTEPNPSSGVGIRTALENTPEVRAMQQKLLAVRDWGYCDMCHASGPRRWNICKVCLARG